MFILQETDHGKVDKMQFGSFVANQKLAGFVVRAIASNDYTTYFGTSIPYCITVCTAVLKNFAKLTIGRLNPASL